MFKSVKSQINRMGYQVIKDLGRGHYSKVFLIRKDDSQYVFKFPEPGTTYCWDGEDYAPIWHKKHIEHVRREGEVLQRIKGVDGFPKLIESPELITPWSTDLKHRLQYVWGIIDGVSNPYKCDSTMPSTIQEFIDGNVLRVGDKIEGVENQKILIDAINALHEAKIAGLNLHPEHIIKTPSGKPYIIDVGHCVFEDHWRYEDNKDEDLIRLENILS